MSGVESPVPFAAPLRNAGRSAVRRPLNKAHDQNLNDDDPQEHAYGIDRRVRHGRMIAGDRVVGIVQRHRVGHAAAHDAGYLSEIEFEEPQRQGGYDNDGDEREEESQSDPEHSFGAHDRFDEMGARFEPQAGQIERQSQCPEHQVGAQRGVGDDVDAGAEGPDQDAEDDRAACESQFDRETDTRYRERDASQQQAQEQTDENRNQVGFVELFDGDGEKIDEMNRRIAAEFGFSACFPVCGQTYPRKTDSRILGCLSGIAQSAYRMANDIRLLQHDRQLEEPFEADQIGSSAMAYKRNPMRCERICSLSRYMIADAMNAPMTASVQWLERTLDDSANRRIAMPEGFLCIDAVLRLCQNVTAGLHVNEAIVNRTLREYLPFLATEDLMMEAVKRGGDRQQLHEIIRRHSMAATKRMKEGLPCDLLDRLAGDPVFGLSRSELEQLMEPRLYIGRCPQQVRKFLDACTPLLRQAQAADGDIRI